MGGVISAEANMCVLKEPTKLTVDNPKNIGAGQNMSMPQPPSNVLFSQSRKPRRREVGYG